MVAIFHLNVVTGWLYVENDVSAGSFRQGADERGLRQ